MSSYPLKIKQLKNLVKLNQEVDKLNLLPINNPTDLGKTLSRQKALRTQEKLRSRSTFLRKRQLELEKQIEISRNNQLIYQKIDNHFKELKRSLSRMSFNQSRIKPKKINKLKTESVQSEKTKIFRNLLHKIEEIKHQDRKKFFQRNDFTRQLPKQPKTLFYGIGIIDGVQLKIKILLGSKYCLIGKNNSIKIMFEMLAQEYIKLQRQYLWGNPCNIFKLLTIKGSEVKLKNRKTMERIIRQQQYRYF